MTDTDKQPAPAVDYEAPVAPATLARMDPRVNWIAMAWAVNTFGFSITYPFLPLYLNTRRGVPMSKVGLFFLVMGAARIIGPMIAGVLADRFGRRRLMIFGPLSRMAVFVALALLVATDASILLMGAGLFVGALVGGFFGNASNAYVTDITSSDQRPEAFSRLRIGLNIGWMAGPATGAFLSQSPFSLLFAITGVLCIIPAALAWKFCPEPPRARTERIGWYSPWSLFAPLRRDPAIMAHLGFGLLLFLVTGQLVSTLSVFSHNDVGVPTWQVGLLYTINGLTVILLQLPVNRLLKHTNLAVRIMIGCAFYAVGYSSVGWAANWWFLAGSVIVLTCGELMTEPAMVSAVSRMAPETHVGRYMGLYTVVRGLGFSMGPFVGGIAYDTLHHNPPVMWAVLAGGAVLAAGGFFLLRKLPAME